MLPEESRLIGEWIRELQLGPGSTVLNVGSSTRYFREHVQPWIDHDIFAPIRATGATTVHIDTKTSDGVDYVGDVCGTATRHHLRALNASLIICSNVLEHVESPLKLASAIEELAPSGCTLVITVPYQYHYHKDPIDNFFRPRSSELAACFPRCKIEAACTVVASDRYIDILLRNPRYAALVATRCLMPWYRPRDWWKTCRSMIHLFQPFSASCVMMRRT
jgi:hypothetical protein